MCFKSGHFHVVPVDMSWCAGVAPKVTSGGHSDLIRSLALAHWRGDYHEAASLVWIGRPNGIELVPLLPCHPGGLLGCREREVLVIVLETLLLPVNYAPNTTELSPGPARGGLRMYCGSVPPASLTC